MNGILKIGKSGFGGGLPVRAAAILVGLVCLTAAAPLSASSVRTCGLKAKILKVYPSPASKTARLKAERRVRIQVRESRFTGGHSMGRFCRMKGLKLDVNLRIKPSQTQVLRPGAVIDIRHRTVVNRRRVNGKWRFVRFTSWRYLPPRNNNRPVPPRPR